MMKQYGSVEYEEISGNSNQLGGEEGCSKLSSRLNIECYTVG